MASGVAHDVNNALSPIVAYADLLLAKLPDLPADSREHLQIIKRSGKDIAQIVARMREFYRRRSESEPLVEVNIHQIIQEVTELTRPRWRDISQRSGISINVVHAVEPGLPPLLSDPGEFREALMNLVFNAVDALPQGGTITLAARVVAPAKPGKNDDPVRQLQRQLQIEVKDNGTGMEEKVRQRCLEPFFSTKSLHGGTGLGLAMVYGMVQRHEGNIEIESASGAGTCIRLSFPVREKPATTVPETVSRPETGSSLRVLCVDDDELIRQLLVDCLVQYQHQVVTASGGEEGLELFRAAALKKQPFHAVITDLGMPQMDGHQFARKIKSEAPHTPIIMMTGWGTIMKEDGETAHEVDAVMGKPPHLQELNQLLLRLAAGSNKRPA
jgi:CheY-like chemotaxis protein